MRKVAIIGGSGLESFMQASDRLSHTGIYKVKQESGLEVFFVARHGEEHEFLPLDDLPPRQVEYMGQLRQHGVEAVVSYSATGSLDEHVPLANEGSFVVMRDFIRGIGWQGVSARIKESPHVDMTHPFDEELRRLVIQAGQDARLRMHDGGLYIQNGGNNIESAAEVAYLNFMLRLADREGKAGTMSFPGMQHLTHLYAQVGMTAIQEVVLAREYGMGIVVVACPVNYGAGMTHETFSHEGSTLKVIEGAKPHIKSLTDKLLERLAA